MKMSELKSTSEQAKANRRMRIKQIEQILESGLINHNPKHRIDGKTLTQMKKDEPKIGIPFYKKLQLEKEFGILKQRI